MLGGYANDQIRVDLALSGALDMIKASDNAIAPLVGIDLAL